MSGPFVGPGVPATIIVDSPPMSCVPLTRSGHSPCGSGIVGSGPSGTSVSPLVSDAVVDGSLVVVLALLVATLVADPVGVAELSLLLPSSTPAVVSSAGSPSSSSVHALASHANA